MDQENNHSGHLDFLGISLSRANRVELAQKISEFATSSKKRFIAYSNSHCLNIYFSDNQYKEVIKRADLVYAGGQGVVWAARFLGFPLPERVNILDFLDLLIEKLQNTSTTISKLSVTS